MCGVNEKIGAFNEIGHGDGLLAGVERDQPWSRGCNRGFCEAEGLDHKGLLEERLDRLAVVVISLGPVPISLWCVR